MTQGPPLFPGGGGDPSADMSSRPPGGPPREARAAVVVLTILGAVLVFFGVLYLVMTKDLEVSLRSAFDSAGQAVPFDSSTLQLTIRLAGGLQILVGVGAALAAQGVRGRKGYARPLGYVAAGIVVALGLVSLLTGAPNVPLIILTALGMTAIYLLSKPAMRTYLSRRSAEPPRT